MDVMARSKWGLTPLHYAAKVSNLANIRVLLDAGADVRARAEGGATPSHEAAYSGTPANIQVLLAAGADAKTTNEAWNAPFGGSC